MVLLFFTSFRRRLNLANESGRTTASSSQRVIGPPKPETVSQRGEDSPISDILRMTPPSRTTTNISNVTPREQRQIDWAPKQNHKHGGVSASHLT